MQVTETLSDGLKRAYTVVVPAADIEGKRTARLSELGRTLRLPGFRPGKVPLGLVRQRYGTAVMAEVLEESVSQATQQVLSDRGLRPAMQPKVDVVSLGRDPAEGKDLEFKVELELLPEIPTPDLAALELTRLKAQPDPEAIDRALSEIANRQRELLPVEEDRGAEKGETLTVDFTGRIDGVAFTGGSGADVNVEVAGPGFIPGFTEQLEGMKPGEAREIQVTFPEEYQVKELAGKPASFEIVAKQLRRSQPAAIDQALAEKIGFENLDEVREALSAQMQREYDQLSRLRIKRQLLDALADRATFPAPEGMVEAEFAQIWQRIEADRKDGKTDDDDAGKDDETLKTEYRGIAERRVKLGLLLSEIGRANGITVGADEMTRAMRTEASRYAGQEAAVMEFFRKNPQAAESLRGPLFEDKVVDFILELAKVEERPVSVAELVSEPPAATSGGQAAPEAAADTAADSASGDTPAG
jgi:trigger factor